MSFPDRIQELIRIPAAELRPHPRNWRTHPAAQRDALRGVLSEIGYADALVARRLADGSLQLIDGHLRAELDPAALVPVLVVGVNDDEALKLLATLDPLSAAAGTDHDLLTSLVADVQTDSAALRALLDSLAAEPLPLPDDQPAWGEQPIPESFQVVVQCDDERQQRQVYEELTRDGYRCRLLSL